MDFLQFLPAEWSNNDYTYTDHVLVDIPEYSPKYIELKRKVQGGFNLETIRIQRIQNPYIYTQFRLKQLEYRAINGSAPEIVELYHDTGESKVASIASRNLDWRLANRVKYGVGVSFSPFPAYANSQSSHSNGTSRAMIIADVLVGNSERVSYSRTLPDIGKDTSISTDGNVYVKYYDDEFYPKYAVYYRSTPPVFRRRRQW